MKGMLVFDMPDCCGNCQLLQQWYDDEHEEWYEMCFYRYCKIENTESKLNICPIKPLPEKKVPVFEPNDCDIEEEIKIIHEIEGYNRCIDEILGETK